MRELNLSYLASHRRYSNYYDNLLNHLLIQKKEDSLNITTSLVYDGLEVDYNLRGFYRSATPCYAKFLLKSPLKTRKNVCHPGDFYSGDEELFNMLEANNLFLDNPGIMGRFDAPLKFFSDDLGDTDTVVGRVERFVYQTFYCE